MIVITIIIIIVMIMIIIWSCVHYTSSASKVSPLLIAYGATLLNADWFRRKAFLLNHENVFGNQEGIIR